MDLQTRKLKFIQEFLQLQSEEAVARLEKLLKNEKKQKQEKGAMTKEELHERIAQAENDFENNRLKNTSDLLSKYK